MKTCKKGLHQYPDEDKRCKACMSSTGAKRQAKFRLQRPELNNIWKKNNPDKTTEYCLLKKYGITLDQYNQMFADQKGCCAICSRHQSQFKRALAVDHNHETGEVRGLLCSSCNVGIGFLKDSSKLMQLATNYLKKFNS